MSIKYLYDNTIMKVFSIFLLEGFNAGPTKQGYGLESIQELMGRLIAPHFLLRIYYCHYRSEMAIIIYWL